MQAIFVRPDHIDHIVQAGRYVTHITRHDLGRPTAAQAMFAQVAAPSAACYARGTNWGVYAHDDEWACVMWFDCFVLRITRYTQTNDAAAVGMYQAVVALLGEEEGE